MVNCQSLGLNALGLNDTCKACTRLINQKCERTFSMPCSLSAAARAKAPHWLGRQPLMTSVPRRSCDAATHAPARASHVCAAASAAVSSLAASSASSRQCDSVHLLCHHIAGALQQAGV